MPKQNVLGIVLLIAFFLSVVSEGTEVFIEAKRTTDEPFFPAGEELLYEVSWWKFKLGTIRTKVLRVTKTGNSVQTHAAVYIDSYSWIPFVSLHTVFDVLMDESCYSVVATSLMQEDGRWALVRYRYNRIENLLCIDRGYRREIGDTSTIIERIDTLSIHPQTQDGLSLVYFARKSLRSNRTIIVPTIADSLVGRTVLNFSNKRTSIRIDAVNYPVDVVEFDGRAEFKGIFGLSGNFTGWFSNDDATVPISARLNVTLGAVTIELKEWHRQGWQPPEAEREKTMEKNSGVEKRLLK